MVFLSSQFPIFAKGSDVSIRMPINFRRSEFTRPSKSYCSAAARRGQFSAAVFVAPVEKHQILDKHDIQQIQCSI